MKELLRDIVANGDGKESLIKLLLKSKFTHLMILRRYWHYLRTKRTCKLQHCILRKGIKLLFRSITLKPFEKPVLLTFAFTPLNPHWDAFITHEKPFTT